MKRLFDFLKPPVFEDEVKTQKAYLLNIIIWALIAAPLPYLALIYITPVWDLPQRGSTQIVIIEIVAFFLLYLSRRGFTRPASSILISSMWVFLTVSAATAGGTRGESYLLGYPLVIIIAGLLLHKRLVIWLCLSSLLAGHFMTLMAGRESPLYYASFKTWYLSVAIFSVSTILQYVSATIIEKSFYRAKQSEEKYRIIANVGSDYIFESRVDEHEKSHAFWLAGAFEKITGYTPEEYFQAGGWNAHLHPDDTEKDKQDMQTLLNNQAILGSEIRAFNKSGEIRWVRIRAQPIWDEKENRLVGILGAGQDITQQKEAERLLRDALQKQEALLNNIPDIAWMKDTEGRYIAVNEVFMNFNKATAEEVLGKTDFDIWDPGRAKLYERDDQDVLQSGKRKTVEEVSHKDKHGVNHWVETVKTPIRDEEGKIIGTVGIARDITERKAKEEAELRRRTLLEKVIELGKQVTETTDLDTIIEKVWRGVRETLDFDRVGIFLYDYETETMRGTLGTDKQGNQVCTRGSVVSQAGRTRFKTLLEAPDSVLFTEDYENEVNLSSDSDMRGVKNHVAVAVWAGNKPLATISADQAISQRPILPEQVEALRLFAGYVGLGIENARLNEALQKELEKSQEAVRELENKNAELERFTYTVSHDLKSPLVTITGFLGYLEQGARGGDLKNFERDMNRIRSAAQKMQTLLNDLLELSRIGRLVNEATEVEFSVIVRDALGLLEGAISEKRVYVEFIDEKVVVFGDRIRLLEVVQNLVENAIKFMGTQPNPQIEIGTFKDPQNQTIFFVRDNGVGIELQHQERIFGLFNKLDAQGEGTGIGLTLVKRIVEVHHGKIWIESEASKGTAFYFTLPVVEKTK
ncbi:MAG: PAS domain S-box protein [Anaerolineales bacterium]|nr:PAS domain S-box protein [Anaerolineales bacterium]